MVQIGDTQHPWHEGMTVDQLISNMNQPYRYALVRLNGKVVTEPFFKNTLVPDKAEVHLIPMIAGG